MKNKFLNVVLVLAILSILSIVSVNAAISLVTPTASGTVTGTNVLAVKVPLADSGSINFTCNIYAKSALTANNSWTIIKTMANNTHRGNDTWTNSTFASSILEDANNYIFNASCWNDTTMIGSVAANTAIIVDNTDPTAPSSLTPTSDTDGTVDFSSTVVDRETTSCVLYFTDKNPGATSYAMIHTSGTSTCTYTGLLMPEQSYQWYVRASDETNTIDSSTQTTNVDVVTSAGKAATLAAQQQILTAEQQAVIDAEQEQTRNTVLWVIGIAVAGIILFVIVRRWNAYK